MITQATNECRLSLERALRRHGIEGEAAFQHLVARYLELIGGKPGHPARRFIRPAKRALALTKRDGALTRLMDELIGADPHGETLADWYQHCVGRRYRGGSGKFFTPRPVADQMAGLLPRVDRAVIMDPACGGGGFLLAASKRWGDAGCHLVGNDVEPALVALTEISLALATPAGHRRSLVASNLYEFGRPLARWRGKVDYILANPPFSLPLASVRASSRLFALGYRTSDAVFIDLCFELLKPGGRLVCLLPHSLVVNAEFHKLRAAVETMWRLRGVIVLPEGVFHLAADTTTRADILILDKPAADDARRPRRAVFASVPTVGVRLNQRMKDDSNALAEVVARQDVADALGLNRE